MAADNPRLKLPSNLSQNFVGAEDARIRETYYDEQPKAQRYLQALLRELGELLSTQEITLAVPLEGRVKTLSSMYDKISRKDYNSQSARDFDDFVGIRIIVLFMSDLDKAINALRESFDIIEAPQADTDLKVDHFGYQSKHFVIELTDHWLTIPSLRQFADFRAEIQIRTLAQHMWAAASHKLQYKREESVPPPLRRTIHRASALLETVDLEFDRVLMDRARYVETLSDSDVDTSLDVEIVKNVLTDVWPSENLDDEDEQYGKILAESLALGVKTKSDLTELLLEMKKAALAHDHETVMSELSGTTSEPDRVTRGVFFTHTGLTRIAFQRKFGETAWRAAAKN